MKEKLEWFEEPQLISHRDAFCKMLLKVSPEMQKTFTDFIEEVGEIALEAEKAVKNLITGE